MPKARIRKDLPMLPDDLVRREDIPGTGKLPKELEELVRNNALYLHGKSGATPRLELKSIATEADFSAWSTSLGAGVAMGLPGQALEQIAPNEIAIKHKDARSQESLRPEWATLSFNPRPSTPRPVHFLRRRNGNAVRPHFVIGKDGRHNFFPNTWPWICAGRIDATRAGGGSWSGSGALVGKNVVLTASHMVPWGAGPGNWTMKFTPAFYDGESTLGAGVFSWVQKARGYPDFNQGDDMAVLKLYTPLGSSLGYFGYKTYTDDWEDKAWWTLVGYPGSVGGGMRPTRQSDIKVIDDDYEGDSLELEHTGDTTDGNSGGPLFGWWGNSPRVIGTHSGDEYNTDEDNNVAAGGPALAKLIKYARDNW